jgi:hypothetical protein
VPPGVQAIRSCWIATDGQLNSIEHQGGLHGGMVDALVPVQEGVGLDQGKPKAAAFAVNPG